MGVIEWLERYTSRLNSSRRYMKLGGLMFKHVLREGNVCADFLARLGRNSTLGVTTWVTPPNELLSLLNFDAFDF
ncbi:hypothetical protein MTR_6g091740 [Medicago truncatula]|uniref:RNase H type-1 domain-containing protein n=1 Tax=Medicago truncatula TaxID=3880 RepID=G7KJ77_MEDTR|nr:hypothetical protein MTR_6g091740 [Medicago truncatula]